MYYIKKYYLLQYLLNDDFQNLRLQKAKFLQSFDPISNRMVPKPHIIYLT